MKLQSLRLPRSRLAGRCPWIFRRSLLLLALGVAPCVHAQSSQDLINQMHSLRDRYAGSRPPSGGNERAPRTNPVEEAWAKKMAEQDRANAARVDRQQKHFAALGLSANEALGRNDYPEALRWLKALNDAHRDAGIFDPRLQQKITRTEALRAWSEARTAEEYRRAIAIEPDFFSKQNLDYVESLEAAEQYRREVPKRIAAAETAGAKMRGVMDTLIASITAPLPQPEIVLTGDAKNGRHSRDYLAGTLKAEPGRKVDDGTSVEHDSIEHRLGFDTIGRLKGEPPITPEAPAGRLTIPERLRSDPKFINLPAVVKLREFEATAGAAQQVAITTRARLEMERAKDPSSAALPMMQFRAKEAESRAKNAENMVAFQTEEVVKTVSFEGFDLGEPATASPKTPVASTPAGPTP